MMTGMDSEPIRWEWCRFRELGVERLYAVLAVRDAVFVVEQRCIYLEADGVDPHCRHLLGWCGDRLVAYLRLLPEGLYCDGAASLGRILVVPELRGIGLGRELVERGLDFVRRSDAPCPVRIKAQQQLTGFYAGFGFEPVGEVFDEDGILHQEMVLSRSRLLGRQRVAP